MIEEIISAFIESKNVSSFDFSLRPSHNIDNPYAASSMDIFNNLEKALTNADKPALVDVLLNEAEENINFSYKVFSQIVDITAENEGLLYKARLMEILNKIESSNNNREVYDELITFTDTLSKIIENHIHSNKLKNAFITTLLLFETAEEMRIREMFIPFVSDYKAIITEKYLIFLQLIAGKAYLLKDKTLNNFIISEILQYINRFAYYKNVKLCYDMMFFASILTDMESASAVCAAAFELQKETSLMMPKSVEKYIFAGTIYAVHGPDSLKEYVCRKIKEYYFINTIAHTCIITDDLEAAKNILEFFLENRRVPKDFAMSFYQQLQLVYSILQNEEKIADIAKKRFALGDINAYFDAVEAYTSIGMYEQEKDELHNIACMLVPLYDYCSLLADNKEFTFLVDRFNMIKSTKELNEAVNFMDDKGIALYDNNINNKLLNILVEKTKKSKKLSAHVNSLLSLITT